MPLSCVLSRDQQSNHVILFHISRWQQVPNYFGIISDGWMPQVVVTVALWLARLYGDSDGDIFEKERC